MPSPPITRHGRRVAQHVWRGLPNPGILAGGSDSALDRRHAFTSPFDNKLRERSSLSIEKHIAQRRRHRHDRAALVCLLNGRVFKLDLVALKVAALPGEPQQRA